MSLQWKDWSSLTDTNLCGCKITKKISYMQINGRFFCENGGKSGGS